MIRRAEIQNKCGGHCLHFINDKFEYTEEDKKFPIEKFCFLKNYEKNKDSKLKVEKQSWGEESTE